MASCPTMLPGEDGVFAGVLEVAAVARLAGEVHAAADGHVVALRAQLAPDDLAVQVGRVGIPRCGERDDGGEQRGVAAVAARTCARRRLSRRGRSWECRAAGCRGRSPRRGSIRREPERRSAGRPIRCRAPSGASRPRSSAEAPSRRADRQKGTCHPTDLPQPRHGRIVPGKRMRMRGMWRMQAAEIGSGGGAKRSPGYARMARK